MKIRIFSMAIVIMAITMILTINAFAAAPNTQWSKTFGGSGRDDAYSVQTEWILDEYKNVVCIMPFPMEG